MEIEYTESGYTPKEGDWLKDNSTFIGILLFSSNDDLSIEGKGHYKICPPLKKIKSIKFT